MLMLALDTATPRASVAVVSDDGMALELCTTENPGQFVVALLDSLLADAGVRRSQLTHVVVGVGPGPYTATRVGVTVALGIGRALDLPVSGVCTLDAIAAEALDRSAAPGFGVATDARRREVYWAIYDGQGARVRGPAVTKPGQLLEAELADVWAGDGFGRYRELTTEHAVTLIDPRFPSAIWLARLAIRATESGEQPPDAGPSLGEHGSDGSGAIGLGATILRPYPLYLRRPEAREPQVVSSA